MKISGTILNSKNNEPIALAKIRLKVQDKETGTPFFTDEHGYYEFKSDQDYIGQILTYTIEKDGFEEKTFSTVVDKAEVQKKFLLRKHEILVDRKRDLKIIVSVFLFIIVVGLVICFCNPQLHYELIPENTPDYNLSLNNKYIYNYTVTYYEKFPYNFQFLREIRPLKWAVEESEEWIYVDRKVRNGSENISVTLYTPDSKFSPGIGSGANITLRNERWDLLYFINKTHNNVNIQFEIPGKKNLQPELSVGISLLEAPLNVKDSDSAPIPIQVKNNNTNQTNGGTLYWSIKDNVTWIKLLNGNGDQKSRIIITDFEDPDNTYNEPQFKIDFTELNITKGETESARITVESNNDGKVKIYISVKRLNSTYYEISHIKTEDWYGPNVIYNLV